MIIQCNMWGWREREREAGAYYYYYGTDIISDGKCSRDLMSHQG